MDKYDESGVASFIVNAWFWLLEGIPWFIGGAILYLILH